MDDETLQRIADSKTRWLARTHTRGRGDGTVTVATLLDHDIATLLHVLDRNIGGRAG